MLSFFFFRMVIADYELQGGATRMKNLFYGHPCAATPKQIDTTANFSFF